MDTHDAVEMVEPELLDDDLAPDDDDYDELDLPDPEAAELDAPPEDEHDDTAVAGAAPQAPAEQDADDDMPFALPAAGLDDAEGVARAPMLGGADAAEAALIHRWKMRLRIREQLLADARSDLARAKSPAEAKACKARVAKRSAQVSYARRVLERHEQRQTTVIERVVRAALLGHDKRDQIHYTMDAAPRWMGIAQGKRSKKGQFPTQADCSSYVTWCYWDALGGPKAGPDIINGHRWAAGFTGTQLDNGRQVPISQARAGDLAFYNRGNGIGHVTIVVAPGRVVSHGSEPGPHLLKLNYDGKLAQVRRYIA